MEIYGLPFFDLPGISSVHDLSDPANAKRMGEAMHARWRAGMRRPIWRLPPC